MAVGEVRNVRQLRGRIVADVLVGHDDAGRTITLHVEVNPFAKDVKPALEQLQAVIRERAFSSVTEVHERRLKAAQAALAKAEPSDKALRAVKP